MTHGHCGGMAVHHAPTVHHHHHTPSVHHHHHSQSHHKHSQSHHRHSQSHHRHSQNHHHSGRHLGHHGHQARHPRHHHHRHHCLPWEVLPFNDQYLQVVTANPVQVKTRKPSRTNLVVVGGGASPDLKRINVTIKRPPFRLGDVTYYEVQVHPMDPGAAPWRVLRRYNHFRALAAEPSVKSDFPLPPKLWTKSANKDPEQLEARRLGLAMWLQGAIELSPRTGPLAKFLLLGRCALEPLGVEALQPSAPEMEDMMTLLEVQVPEGLGPDDLMKVKVGSEVVTISLPWGLAPSSPLRLWWDPSNHSLAVHQIQDWQALRK